MSEVITAQSFTAKKQTAPIVVVEFGATWCEPCQQFNELLPKLEDKFPQPKYLFYTVDIDDPANSGSHASVLMKQEAKLLHGVVPQIAIFLVGEHRHTFMGFDQRMANTLVQFLAQLEIK